MARWQIWVVVLNFLLSFNLAVILLKKTAFLCTVSKVRCKMRKCAVNTSLSFIMHQYFCDNKVSVMQPLNLNPLYIIIGALCLHQIKYSRAWIILIPVVHSLRSFLLSGSWPFRSFSLFESFWSYLI